MCFRPIICCEETLADTLSVLHRYAMNSSASLLFYRRTITIRTSIWSDNGTYFSSSLASGSPSPCVAFSLPFSRLDLKFSKLCSLASKSLLWVLQGYISVLKPSVGSHIFLYNSQILKLSIFMRVTSTTCNRSKGEVL